jgi:hypothetical protein
MCKVANRHSVLLLDIRVKWSLVVDLEIEDSVLVWQLEAGGMAKA